MLTGISSRYVPTVACGFIILGASGAARAKSRWGSGGERAAVRYSQVIALVRAAT